MKKMKMTNDNIERLRQLLDSYYGGKTSEADEHELRGLLDSPSLPQDFETDRRMMNLMGRLTVADGFEKRLEDRIDAMAAAEDTDRATRRKSLIRRRLAGIAATVAVVSGVGFSVFGDRQPQGSDLTPEETCMQTEMALAVFADALNKGCEGLKKAETTTGDATQRALASLGAIMNGVR